MSDHLIAEANRHAKALPVNPDRLALALALETIAQLERDLAAAQAEVAQLQHDLAAAQDEIAQLGREQYAAERELDAARQRETVAIASWDEERGRALREGARVVEWIARADRAEAELAAARGERDAANQHCKILNDSNDAKARLIEAQIADLAALRSKLAL